MDEQSIRLPLRKTRKIGFELTGLADSKRFDLDIACLGSNLDMLKQNRTEKSRLPICAFGPFSTAAAVPAQDFLASNQFTHAGSWNVPVRLRDAFSANRDGKAGTWYWFDSGTDKLARIMNVDGGNSFQIAVLGAYYLVDLQGLRRHSSSLLADVYKLCLTARSVMMPPSPMLTLSDILNAMASSPCGSQTPCTMRQIQKVIPGISPPTGTVTPPSWTHRVNSQCYMVGPHTSPAYPEFWARSIAGRWRKIEELCILDLDPTERTASLRSSGSPLRCDEPILRRPTKPARRVQMA
jgi:hypothetical protein